MSTPDASGLRRRRAKTDAGIDSHGSDDESSAHAKATRYDAVYRHLASLKEKTNRDNINKDKSPVILSESILEAHETSDTTFGPWSSPSTPKSVVSAKRPSPSSKSNETPSRQRLSSTPNPFKVPRTPNASPVTPPLHASQTPKSDSFYSPRSHSPHSRSPQKAADNVSSREIELNGYDLYTDAWGEAYISPSKLLKTMKPGISIDTSLDADDELTASSVQAVMNENGAIFNAIIWFSTALLSPFGIRSVTFVSHAFYSFYALMQVMLFGFVCICNPFDSWGQQWGSINVFTGAMRLPAMDLAKKYPLLFRPLGIKKLEWDNLLGLVSFAGGIHVAINVNQFNTGLIIERLEKDRKKLNRWNHDHMESSTSEATKAARDIGTVIRSGLETFRNHGINIALSIEQLCVAVEHVKVSLDGIVTRRDDWWAQSAHYRVKDLNFTLSGSAQGGYVSYDVLEMRLLEDEDDLYAPNDSYDNDVNDDIAARLTEEARASDLRSEMSHSPGHVNRQLFTPLKHKYNASDDGYNSGSYTTTTTTQHLSRHHKDHFSLALNKAPLLSLSAFSFGFTQFLEIAQLDFSSRQSMMDS